MSAIEKAAEMLRHEAESLAACHMFAGSWNGDDDTKQTHDNLIATADEAVAERDFLRAQLKGANAMTLNGIECRAESAKIAALLPDYLFAGSKDWREGGVVERVEWLLSMYAAAKADAWYRPTCDCEMYEGPVHHKSPSGKLLRDEKPGEWKPLYANPVPPTPSVPEGWKLVPIKPTLEMVRAFASAARAYMAEYGGNSPQVMWKAMLAAAPKPEVK